MIETVQFNPVPTIATELALNPSNVAAVISMLNEGNTVPFIARYRKEMTGSMDEIQIRTVEERNIYLTELEKRRAAILESIESQGKLTDELKNQILACTTKSTLEDLYLPYKPKRRTRATIARERGLEPLANLILAQALDTDVNSEAVKYVNEEKEVPSVEAALEGARDIVSEIVAENAEIRSSVREKLASDGLLESSAVEDKKEEGAKFKDYFEFDEPVSSIPSHRFLAVRRGEREGFLRTSLSLDAEPLILSAQAKMNLNPASPFASHLELAVQDAFSRLLLPSVESDVRIDLKMRADREAVEVFASNLRALLLAAPLGDKSVIGVDPGLRTGCKCTAVDANGNFMAKMTFNIVQGDRAMDAGKMEFQNFVQRYNPIAIAVGNGTGGRETEKFVRGALKEMKHGAIVVQVSEAGASVYSASPLAAKEFPDLDLTFRGAISIARRLQDPLAELVKIDPKSIGVGQYQHDVHQPLLGRKLDEVVESCVNGVGVELNTASVPLLSQVAGIGPKTAENIVEFRAENAGFKNRKQLLKVKGLGPKAFEQAAGFLRVAKGENPLDASAVHPERYELVESIAKDMGVTVADLVGNAEMAAKIDIKKYVSDVVGEPTLRDIIDELKKPGRDPRDEFEAPAFRDDINTIDDLEEGMTLEGVVTNVTNFGAFVDVGVHRDGLVHVSELSDTFVSDPMTVVKVGQKLKVRVLEVDKQRQRISFSAKSAGENSQRGMKTADGDNRSNGGGPRRNDGPRRGGGGRNNDSRRGGGGSGGGKSNQFSYNPFAAAFNKK
ncbi:MAG: RNA-binding transcriptional accessory protein [Deltaproteobacteria bacterium]|nr:RNA-binding transcriptional accessory protein [Deltaproteobacteria bacterium]MBN2670125.1 RNA-binding transcriptional accessory protein [Deltaproteobacteria bacterium]